MHEVNPIDQPVRDLLHKEFRHVQEDENLTNANALKLAAKRVMATLGAIIGEEVDLIAEDWKPQRRIPGM